MMRKPSPVARIVARYSALRGPLVFGSGWKTARKHASAMLKAGFTEEEILACIERQHVEHPSWNWSLAYVARQLPQFRREREEGRMAVDGLKLLVFPPPAHS